MSIILIYSKSDYPPMGVLYLCDALEKSNIKCKILPSDTSEQEIKKCINKINPVAIGMSVTTSPEISSFIKHSIFIKNNFPKIPVIWGGVHPSINQEQCANENFIDYIITGQAEEIFPKVISNLESGSKPEKIIGGEGVRNLDNFYPSWGKIDIEKFTFPEEHSVHSKGKLECDKKEGEKKQNIFYYLLTSRGCPYKCTFCSEPLGAINKNPCGKYNWNAHSFDWFKKQVDYIENRLKQKGIKLDGIGLWDDMFWIDMKRAYLILDFLKSRRIGYLIEARADYLIRNNAALLKKLADTGCIQVFIGAESADQNTLNYLGKGTKFKDYKKILELAEKYHIAVRSSFIVGFPGETDDSVNKTLDFVEWIKRKKNDFASISGPKLFTPYPGTIEFNRAVEKGFKVPKNTLQWSEVHRNSQRYLEIFPWLKNNLKSETIARLKTLFGEGL